MACESKEEPGRKFQNTQHGMTFDRTRREQKGAKKDKPQHEEPDGDEEKPIHEVVAEHGPADKTEIEKEGEIYTVHSHHGGHKHSSHGHSIHEAHEHSLAAHGAEPMEQEPEGMAGGEAMPMTEHATPPGM